jgi:hypothetical protein
MASKKLWTNMITIVSYGGGTNSTAMLVGLHERGERPTAITFADTGGEKPNTYTHIVEVNKWCERVGFPRIETLSALMPQQVLDGTLEQECLRLGKLPAKAYGLSSCSDKWKMESQRRYNRRIADLFGLEQTSIVRLIGFDADEELRVSRGKSTAYKRQVKERYPLHEWEWGRDECVEAIARAGLSQPGKSACFFCPSSKKQEIIQLARDYPALARRALEMERRALAGEGPSNATTSKGLGRGFAWADVLAGKISTTEVGMPEIDCGCYDGD